MPKPANAKTTISPKVSVPRKSTKITFTTLVPPPPGTELARKKSEIGTKFRVITAIDITMTPIPDSIEITKSLEIRRRLISLGLFCGNK